MKSTVKLEKYGTKRVGIAIEGNQKKPEPQHLTIDFPGAQIEITRATDVAEPDYWIHITVSHPDNPNDTYDYDGNPKQHARVLDARIGLVGGADANLGDLNNPKLRHLALRICRGSFKKTLPVR